MREKIRNILRELSDNNDFNVEKAPEGRGDYASNIAFYVAKEEKKSPEKVAEEIKAKIDSELFSRIEVVDGFLNFTLSDEIIKEELLFLLEEKEDYGKRKEEKTVLIDYSSPNVAKTFGIGHLRSTIIGQSLYNIYEFLGWNAIGVNHLGDWGTQYGKLIYQIKKEGKDSRELSVGEMEKIYVRFHKEAENNSDLEEEGRKWFSKLEKGDKEARRIWKICREKSLREFDEIYKELGVEIDYTLGESFYEDKLFPTIEKVRKKGIAKKSEGALIVEFENMPPAMLLKSDGSTTYFTRDLAAADYRLEKFSPHLIIYEVGAEQTLPMRQLFSTIERMGWKKNTEFVHVAHGMFRLGDKRLSTRKGRTIHLKDVLKEAVKRAEKIVEQSETLEGASSKERKEIAKIVGMGALKYNDLKRHHKRNVVFDWDEILNLKGDSGPYIQYTCVRCKSILQKEKKHEPKIESLNEEERKVLKRIIQFQETVEMAADTFSPNIIAEYAHQLSRDYNLFYDRHSILGNNKRLAITEGTFLILSRCLQLLTIALPSRM